jgi:hypothetical protein
MAIVFSISCCASRQTHFFVQTVPAVHTRGESEATAKKKATTTRFFSSRTQRLGLHNHQRRFRIPNPHTLRACLYIHSGRVCVFFPVFIAKKALPTDHSSRYCQVVQDMSRMTLSVSSALVLPFLQTFHSLRQYHHPMHNHDHSFPSATVEGAKIT